MRGALYQAVGQIGPNPADPADFAFSSPGIYGAASMSPVRAYHLPRGYSPPTRTLEIEGVELQVACPSAEDWGAIARMLKASRQRLARRGTDDVLASLHAAFESWRRPASPQRSTAEQMLPAITGFSPPMIRLGLPLVLAPLHENSIRRLLTRELPPSSSRTAVPPEIIAHVLSGNIPGLGAVASHLSLAVGSAAVLKTARGDPLSTVLWAETIAETDPELGDCLAVTYWPGGDPVELAVFEAADVVVASGSDSAIAAISGRTHRRVCTHGHRISFAAIGRERLADDSGAATLARALARDITLWDQQGCLSPQVCYVEEGGAMAPLDFASMLAEALARDAVALPPRRMSFDEQTAVVRFRQEAEWSADTTLLASEGSTAWSVAVSRDAALRPTCLNRCVRLQSVNRLEDLATALSENRCVLEAAGLAVDPARRSTLARLLGESGVHRICAIGTMQEPPLTWCQSGRPRIGDWIEWMEVEDRDVE